MINWLRGVAWLQPVVRTIAVGGYLVAVSWVTRRLADALARRSRDDAAPGAKVRPIHRKRSPSGKSDTPGAPRTGPLDQATAG